MNLQPKRKWLSAAILAIIIPIAFLTAFKITGIIPEPETITLEAVSWNITRPSYHATIDQKFENKYVASEITTGISIHIFEYFENALMPPFNGRDGLTFNIYVNTTILHGSGNSLAIQCCATAGNSVVYISKQFLDFENVSIVKMKQTGLDRDEAYVKAEILDSPCYLKVLTDWVFDDENTLDHQLNVTLEVTYFNGTAYRKIVLPVRLYVWADAENSFEMAKPIAVGNYTGFLGEFIPTPGYSDLEDYYALWVEEGQKIFIRMQPPANMNVDLYLYDPNKNLLACSCSEQNGTAENIAFTAEASGCYYVKVGVTSGGFGLYTLDVVS